MIEIGAADCHWLTAQGSGKEAKNIRGSTSTRTRSLFDSRERFTFSGSNGLYKEAKNTEGSTSTGTPVIWFGDLASVFGGSPLRNLKRPSLSAIRREIKLGAK